MKSIEDAKLPTVNDTCTHCGSFVDIGAVIEEDDTVLVVNCTGETAKSDAEALAKKAQTRFNDARYDITENNNNVTLTIHFSVSAEKMIFQLQNSL